MDWGTGLWDKINDVDLLFNQKNEFFERALVFLKDQTSACQSHNKHLKKASKLTSLGTKKKQEELSCANSLIDFSESIDRAFDEYTSETSLIISELVETSNELTKVYTDSIAEKKKLFSLLSKSTKELNANKIKVESERKALISKKNEAYSLMENLKNLNKNEEKKVKDFKSSINEKKKAFNKMKSTYDKTTSKYKSVGYSYYNDTLPKLLNELQTLDSTRTFKLKELFDKFLTTYTLHTPKFVTSFSNLQASLHSNVDTSSDAKKFFSAYESREQRPDSVVTFDVVLYEDHTADPDPKDNMVSAGNNRSDKKSTYDGTVHYKLERVDLQSYLPDERANIASTKLPEVEKDISKLEKEIQALMVLGTSSSKFGGETNQVSAIISENQEKLDILKSNYEYYKTYTDCSRKSEGHISWTVDQQNWDTPVSPNKLASSNNSLFNSYAQDDYSTGYDDTNEYNANSVNQEYETKMVAAEFIAEEDGEFSAAEGEILVVLEQDDGSGWTLVARSDDLYNSGFIPSSYLE